MRHRLIEFGFLSTLSLRRATCYSLRYSASGRHFYPRSPCGERRARRASRQQPAGISIHALLAESDSIIDIINNIINDFYPRSPCGERHSADCSCHNARPISIHALLAESDAKPNKLAKQNFKFLSTLSLRRATHKRDPRLYLSVISIHALLAESDRTQSASLSA